MFIMSFAGTVDAAHFVASLVTRNSIFFDASIHLTIKVAVTEHFFHIMEIFQGKVARNDLR